MKRLYLLASAMIAVLALCAITVSSASALESVWLVSGAVPTSQVHVLLTTPAGRTLRFEDTKAGLSGEPVANECVVTGEEELGFVGPEPAMLNLANEDLQETEECLETKFVPGRSGPCETGMVPTVTPDNLPWLTTIELIGSSFYDDIVTEASGQTEIGWQITCLVVGLNFADLCRFFLARALLSNEVNGTVDVVFNSADVNQPQADCERGGTGAGLVDGLLVAEALEGLTLAVSEG
jgi:hypothetical protein